MIDIETIEREIDELEHREASYKLCERLSWLYTVHDHLSDRTVRASRNVPDMGGSEFMDAANGVPIDSLLNVIDEHMEVIRMTYPQTYAAIIDRIKSI